jgi:hypothetical protein
MVVTCDFGNTLRREWRCVMDIINSKGRNIGRSDGAPAVGRSMDVTSRNNKQLGATRQVKRPTSPRAPYSSGLLPVQGACGVLLEHHLGTHW